ncbi:Na+/H+ antiporter NhaC family protein [Dendrosporobacter sp. 1207_IL3150]|uniref:Na+/H+ antiporter NhaC family protein n=1 Tax=Dendrosporobacter sp. 1207_IL3150 TaxID=3084054 RepID=UPI002FDB36A5
MDILIVIILFIISLLFCIYSKISILYPLLLGLSGFIVVSMSRGYNLKDLLKMMLKGSSKSLIVIKIFILIGIITAVWRACGTIAIIVYYGTALLSAKYFILSAFILCCIVSFLLGTSFGTVGTIGVVLIVMAKSGNVDINAVAGAIIAGAYFGDRCSPMSSSANLVAALTNTNFYINFKNMAKTSILPFIISVAAYIYVSYLNPLTFYTNDIGNEILNIFNINFILFAPAIIILVLAAFKVDVKLSMSISILSGIILGLFVQNITLVQMLEYIIAGYNIETNSFFAEIIKGGGLYSMLNVSCIVLISSSFSGIFEGTGLLAEIEKFIERLSKKFRIYPTLILTSIATAAFSCNQTLAVILTHQLQRRIYEKNCLSNYKLALDMENTVILISALIPWNIAGAVPAAALSADSGFIIYAFYLFLVPLTNLFMQQIPVSSETKIKTSLIN